MIAADLCLDVPTWLPPHDPSLTGFHEHVQKYIHIAGISEFVILPLCHPCSRLSHSQPPMQ